jgi:large subunit ribosomal protein L29
MRRIQQLREMTQDELIQRKLEIEEELFNLRMQKTFKELENPLRLRTLRKNVARINTILREDELKIRFLSAENKKKEIPAGNKFEEKDVPKKKTKDENR